ncbi:MAG: ribulose-phosphate 3-epimerase [Spirochaetes bacterium]|nr:ribulose-phosphate 3-epimerase [Spirochaetota bacterium]
MNRQKIIAPSILSCDFSRLGEEVKAIDDAGADWVHVDVMDGHFVPNITFGPLIVEACRGATSLPIDVHLMIENPDMYVGMFQKAGATCISVHVETCVHLNRTVTAIRDLGVRPGVVLNPSTPLFSLEWVLEYVDYVLLLSVNPGFGGQKFIPNSLERIAALRHTIDQKGLPVLIEVDGGVNEETLRSISEAGANIFVAGSAIFGSGDYRKTVEDFRGLIAGRLREG